MPDPISSSNSSLINASYDPGLEDAGQVCRNDVATSSQPLAASSSEPAVAKLVSSVAKPTVLPAASASTGNNNAQRTSERHGIASYAEAGLTGAGDSVYAGAALVKGHDAKSGLEAEVLSVSAQVGLQTELQAGLIRVGTTNSLGSVTIEAFTARGNIGIHNDDGSTGFNIGGVLTALGDETTLGTVNSVTVGVADGAGAALSAGKRDIDHDGNTELCAKATVGPFTGGLCIETPF